MKAADLAVRRPPRPPRPRFILALFRTIFTLAALAICQSTSPSSLSPSQTRTSACSHRINAFDYHVPFLNETALAATLSLYQSIDRPSTVMYQTHPPHFPTTLDLGICTHQSEPVHSHVSATHKRHADPIDEHRHLQPPTYAMRSPYTTLQIYNKSKDTQHTHTQPHTTATGDPTRQPTAAPIDPPPMTAKAVTPKMTSPTTKTLVTTTNHLN